MTYLLHIVVALSLVMAAAEGLALDVQAPWAVATLALVPHALAWLVRKLGVAGRFSLAGWVLLALRHSALGCFALATLVLGWSTSVARWSGTRLDLWSWPGLEILLVLVPFFACACSTAAPSSSPTCGVSSCARCSRRSFRSP